MPTESATLNCGDCDEPLDASQPASATLHASCCGHDTAEDMDSEFGILRGTCITCGASVHGTPEGWEPDDS